MTMKKEIIKWSMIVASCIVLVCCYTKWQDEQQTIDAIHFTQALEPAIWGTHSWHPYQHFIFHRSGKY